MEHNDIKLLLEAYALGALDPEEASEVKVHLESGCRDCLEYLREIEEIATQLPLSLQQCSPSPELKNTIMSKIGNRPLHQKLGRVPPSSGPLIAFAIAATFAIIFGVRLIIFRTEIIDLKVEMASVETEKLKMNRRYAAAIGENELLQEKLVELNSEQTRLNSNIHISHVNQSVLRQQLEDAKRENDKFRAERSTVEAKIAELEKSFKNSKKAIASLSEKLKETADISDLFSTPATQFINLAGVEPNPQAFGRVVLDPLNGNAIVYMYRLPQPPDCMEYQLWVLRDGIPTSAGVFKVGKDGTKKIELNDVAD